MNEPTVDVVVLGVKQHRTDLDDIDVWGDIPQPDAGQDDYVSVALPMDDYWFVRDLRNARRYQTPGPSPVLHEPGRRASKVLARGGAPSGARLVRCPCAERDRLEAAPWSFPRLCNRRTLTPSHWGRGSVKPLEASVRGRFDFVGIALS
jgi:hypothetical protein